MPTLKYYFVKNNIIELIVFNKYSFDNGIIVNISTGNTLRYSINRDGYNICGVCDDTGKRRIVSVARAVASTFLGPPPTSEHTVDHIDRNPHNDTLVNIRWSTKKEQINNRKIPDVYKTAYIVIKDGLDKTIREWVAYLKDDKNPFGREYTAKMITKYAQKKQFGFSYKEYPDLEGEVWKKIIGSENGTGGYWEISDMNRVKYVTNNAKNVLFGEKLGVGGYPMIKINGKNWKCHILSFMTFFPDEYVNKKPNECVLHENDDRLDFRPHKLRLGTQSENMKDAYDNGKRDGTKSARIRCASYIDGVFEIKHDSQESASKYLKSKGHSKASRVGIALALSGYHNTAYGRTWKLIE